MTSEPTRSSIIRDLEDLAEHLTAQQLDLIAQMESQLRAVHHTMRRIGTLRASKRRDGDQLTNGERRLTINDIEDEVAEIETQIDLQQDSCREMHAVVRRMQEAAADLRLIAQRLKVQPHEPSAEA